MASNKPALIPDSPQYGGYGYDEWDTGEWNIAAGWTPPATEQAPPTKNAIDGWDTAEWNMAAGWAELREAAVAAGLMEAEAPHAGPATQPQQPDEYLTGPDAEPYAAPAAESYADPATDPYADPAAEPESGTWNPTRETVAPVRGRHRVAKQRTFGRGSAVFGVAAVAVLGVGGGVATAEGHNPLPVSLPHLPEVSDMPGIGTLLDSDSDSTTEAGDPAKNLGIDAGEALRARILEQAAQQETAAVLAEKQAAQDAAAAQAAKTAAAQKVREEAAAKKAAAEAAAKKAEAARLAALAKSYVKPVASYTLTSSFGETGSLWSSSHTGQDFAAPTGTPVKAVHGGTITSAGWAGSYGYRIILTLDDGTEIWYCHLSSMTVTSGEVSTGDTIGRVGATGNVTGAHLHLEVRPDGGDPIDPLTWLRGKGLTI